jgi:hypothetical protein
MLLLKFKMPWPVSFLCWSVVLWRARKPNRLSLSRSLQVKCKSYVTTDDQSARPSWCQAASGAEDQIFISVRQLRVNDKGFPLRRGDGSVFYNYCRPSPAQSFYRGQNPVYSYMYVQYIYKAWRSRSCDNSCRSCYNGCLVTWSAIRLTIVKLKPLIFSVSGFSYSDVVNICIFMILYDLYLLPAQFRYLIVNIRYLESHVHLVDRCALWKLINGTENLVLQTLQFLKVNTSSRQIQSYVMTDGQSASLSGLSIRYCCISTCCRGGAFTVPLPSNSCISANLSQY